MDDDYKQEGAESPVVAAAEEKKRKGGRPKGSKDSYPRTRVKNNEPILCKGAEKHSAAMKVSREVRNLPPIDKRDLAQVKKRWEDYMAICERADVLPNTVGAARALGYRDRQAISRIAKDAPMNGRGDKSSLPREVREFIAGIYAELEDVTVMATTEGSINPVVGMYLGHGYYDVVEKQQIEVQASRQEEEYDAGSIAERYLGSKAIINAEPIDDKD